MQLLDSYEYNYLSIIFCTKQTQQLDFDNKNICRTQKYLFRMTSSDLSDKLSGCFKFCLKLDLLKVYILFLFAESSIELHNWGHEKNSNV